MVERRDVEPFALCDAVGDELESEIDLGKGDSALAIVAPAVPAGGAVDADCESDTGVEELVGVPVLAGAADFAPHAVGVLDRGGGVGVRDARSACAKGVAATTIELVGDERECTRWVRSVGGAEGARDDHRERRERENENRGELATL